jgi:2-C-methyl-D-erythritol 4-phosphate cytidylyltransferase
MQTPQIFESSLILQAYAAIITRSDMVTDEVSAVQKLGRRVALYNNEDWNFKITFRRDMEMAEHVLKLREEGAAKGRPQ